MDIARERRILLLFEEALDWPEAAREERLREVLADEPEVMASVLSMLRADRSAALIPTIPPELAQPLDEQPAPERIGKYRIIEEIGRGGMGLVYRGARDDGLFEQQVAIKVIRGNILSDLTHEQFETERRILARLHHPHIAHFLDGGVDEQGSPYIIMELINGLPITEYAGQEGLDLAARLALFRDACEALEYAHRELVVHADVKPSNVVVAAGFGVKLLDFGIARLVGEDGGKAGSAHTPGYSSPARRSGERSTPTDDVFALGVLLDQLIADVAGVDEDLRAVAAKAASEDADARYGAVSELIADLDRWRRHQPVSARPPATARAVFLLWQRNRLLIAGSILLVFTALAMTILFLQANAARQSAEQRFAETRSLSNFLVSDVVTDLETMPGTGPLRQRIAERARDALENLSRVPGAPVDLQIETANAYSRVGEILAADDLRDVMDPAVGDAVLAEAEAMLRPLLNRFPDRADLRLSLARTLYFRAKFAGMTQIDQPQTLALLDEVEGLLAAQSEARSGDFAARLLAINATLLRAATFDEEADYDRSIPLARQVLAQAALLHPARLRDQADLAMVQERAATLIGDGTWYDGNHQAALAPYEMGKAFVDNPALSGDVRILKRRGYTTFTVASTLFELGQPDAAVRMSESGLANLERLRLFDSSVSARQMEGILRQDYSYQLQSLGRIAEAYRQNEQAMESYRENARLQPNNYQIQRALPVALRPSGELYRDTGNPALACEQFREAAAIWTRLARENRVSAFDLGNDVRLIKTRLTRC